MAKNVQQDTRDGKWYFWDETEADRCGPYGTKSKAEAAMIVYCAWHLDGKVNISLKRVNLSPEKGSERWCADFADIEDPLEFCGMGDTPEAAVKDLFETMVDGEGE